MDETNGVAELMAAQEIGQGQGGRAAGAVVIGAGRSCVRNLGDVVKMAAHQPQALWMRDAAQVGDDVAPAVGAVGPAGVTDRQTHLLIGLHKIGFGVTDAAGKGVARGQGHAAAANGDGAHAAEVCDAV